jgi:hypothetical protein
LSIGRLGAGTGARIRAEAGARKEAMNLEKESAEQQGNFELGRNFGSD